MGASDEKRARRTVLLAVGLCEAVYGLEVGTVFLHELLKGIVCPKFLGQIFVELSHLAVNEVLKNIFKGGAALQAFGEVFAQFSGQHGHGTLAQLAGLPAAEPFIGFLREGKELGHVVRGLGETAIPDLVVDVIAGVEELNALRPLGELVVTFVQGGCNSLNELTMLRVVGGILVLGQKGQKIAAIGLHGDVLIGAGDAQSSVSGAGGALQMIRDL